MQKVSVAFSVFCFPRRNDTIKLIQLKKDLNAVLNEEEDFVCIIKLMNDNVFGEEILGKPDRETGEQLIL